ncbi:MAG: hypothetical protein Tsb009_34390 [Planctomycetaceae bacterium]
MLISTRLAGFLGIIAAGLLLTLGNPTPAAAQSTAPQQGQLTEQSLGNLIAAMGLKPVKEQKRYDFRFKAILNGEEWELSMSAVLSTNGKSLWVMAWLDELPKSAADVPRTALLRLLASNDRLGKGKFFAYIASNRRFVLQRVIPNENMTTAKFRDVLKDLGATVVVTYPQWSVSNWKNSGNAAKQVAPNGQTPDRSAKSNSTAPMRTTSNSTKFQLPRRN